MGSFLYKFSKKAPGVTVAKWTKGHATEQDIKQVTTPKRKLTKITLQTKKRTKEDSCKTRKPDCTLHTTEMPSLNTSTSSLGSGHTCSSQSRKWWGWTTRTTQVKDYHTQRAEMRQDRSGSQQSTTWLEMGLFQELRTGLHTDRFWRERTRAWSSMRRPSRKSCSRASRTAFGWKRRNSSDQKKPGNKHSGI